MLTHLHLGKTTILFTKSEYTTYIIQHLQKYLQMLKILNYCRFIPSLKEGGFSEGMLKKASDILGVTTQTLRNWNNEGKLKVIRTMGGHRRIPASEIEKIVGVIKEKMKILNNKLLDTHKELCKEWNY